MDAGTLEMIEALPIEQPGDSLRCQGVYHGVALGAPGSTLPRMIKTFKCTVKAVAILSVGCLPQHEPIYVCEALAAATEYGLGSGRDVCDGCKRQLAECWSVTRL